MQTASPSTAAVTSSLTAPKMSSSVASASKRSSNMKLRASMGGASSSCESSGLPCGSRMPPVVLRRLRCSCSVSRARGSVRTSSCCLLSTRRHSSSSASSRRGGRRRPMMRMEPLRLRVVSRHLRRSSSARWARSVKSSTCCMVCRSSCSLHVASESASDERRRPDFQARGSASPPPAASPPGLATPPPASQPPPQARCGVAESGIS
mmetsp:Transcript_46114/g.136279  ORF Transcript_46114/g.136279 Transcript_46114/m.136279 type:complete len:207 (-) Transcript_46114:62-682(-)